MLQTTTLPTERIRVPMSPPPDTEGGDIGKLVKTSLGFLRRRYLVIIVLTVLGVAVSVLYLRTAPPTYTAQVQILLGNQKMQFSPQQSLFAETVIDAGQMETEQQVIRSRATALKVIDQLKLADDPDLNSFNLSTSSFLRI